MLDSVFKSTIGCAFLLIPGYIEFLESAPAQRDNQEWHETLEGIKSIRNQAYLGSALFLGGYLFRSEEEMSMDPTLALKIIGVGEAGYALYKLAKVFPTFWNVFENATLPPPLAQNWWQPPAQHLQPGSSFPHR